MTLEVRDPDEGSKLWCPFCGGLVVVFFLPSLCVGHVLPACRVFLALDGSDYMRAVQWTKTRLN